MIVRTERQGDIFIITVDNPPVNALGHQVRQGLVAAIEAAGQAEGVRAVVMNCAGRTFFAGIR
jgi:3-hydroxyacyl-CoA dehydrogenase